MRKTFKIDLPELVAISVALTVRLDRDIDDGVRAAERRHQEATDRLAGCGREIDRLREAVARGAASPASLEDAMNRAAAAGLVVAPTERLVAEAKTARDRAVAMAKQKVIDQAREWRNELQKTADALAPVLEELRTLESALDRASQAAGGRVVEALVWPSTIQVDIAAGNVIGTPSC